MLPSHSFGGHKGKKWPEVFPPAKFGSSSDRAKNFSTNTRRKSGCVFFSFLKNIVFTGQEKQNTEDLVKNQCFFYHLNFVRTAKFDRNKIWRKEKKHAPRFASSICRKIFSPIGPTVSKKKGENVFFVAQNRFWDKHKLSRKLIFSSTLFSCSKLLKNIDKQQKLKQFSSQRENFFWSNASKVLFFQELSNEV